MCGNREVSKANSFLHSVCMMSVGTFLMASYAVHTRTHAHTHTHTHTHTHSLTCRCGVDKHQLGHCVMHLVLWRTPRSRGACFKGALPQSGQVGQNHCGGRQTECRPTASEVDGNFATVCAIAQLLASPPATSVHAIPGQHQVQQLLRGHAGEGGPLGDQETTS